MVARFLFDDPTALVSEATFQPFASEMGIVVNRTIRIDSVFSGFTSTAELGEDRSVNLDFYSDDDLYRIVDLSHDFGSGPLRMVFEYKTNIISSWSKVEQRIAVRESPRISLSIADNGTGKKKQRYDYLMDSWQGKLMLLPLPLRQVHMTIDSNPGDVSFSVVGDLSFLSPGDTVLLSYDNFIESRRISGVFSNSLSFYDYTSTSWPVGTRIRKAFRGRAQDNPVQNLLTNRVFDMNLSFEVEVGTEFHTPRNADYFVGFREGFIRKPNWGPGMESTSNWEVLTTDFGFGKRDYYHQQKFPSKVLKGEVVARSYDDAWSMIDFFYRHRGRQREFIVPSWQDDVPYSFIGAGSSSIIVEGVGFGQIYANSTVHKRVVMRMADGRLIHRLIERIEVIEENDASVIWLIDPLPMEPFTPASMFGISWGYAARFASDILEVEWVTAETARISLSFQTLENTEI